MSITNPSRIFESLGVNTASPGFYDDPSFVAAEGRDPKLLATYAWFIRSKRFRTDYLDRARVVIESAVRFVHERLDEEQQLGKCIDASLVLLRFLERQGVWCYAAKGALTIFFPPMSGVPTAYFAPIMAPGNPASAGHVWLYAPPYVVVDVATSLQPYRGREREHVPPFVMARSGTPCPVEPQDLMEPEARERFFLQSGYEPTLVDIEARQPGLLADVRAFGPIELRHGLTRMRYITCAVGAPVEPLEQWKNLTLRGRSPAEAYAEFAAEVAKRL